MSAVKQAKRQTVKLRVWQLSLLAAIFFVWWLLTKPGLVPTFVFDNDTQAAFFFGEPLIIFQRIGEWFVTNADIYPHLWTTLVETTMAFVIGTVAGGAVGMWLHQGVELDAPRDSGTDFCRMVRARHGVQGGSRCNACFLHRLF